jgi:hypothetical protein
VAFRVLKSTKQVASIRIRTLITAVVLVVLWGCGIASSTRMSAQTTPSVHYTWRTYTNVRFNYSICYPQELLTPQGESANSDGQQFVAKDGAKLIAYGQFNSLNEPLKVALEDTSIRLAGPSGKVTYKAVKGNWFVISGENGKSVFYAKSILTGDELKSFELTYGMNESETYRPVIERISRCFASTLR